jgi:Zn-dependent protease with chaperone function
VGYFPFLLLMAFSMAGVLASVVALLIHAPLLWRVLFPVFLLVLALLQLAWTTRVLWQKLPEENELELQLPRKTLQGLYDLVADVARQRRLRMPQEIRLAPDTIAYVYEDEEGTEILVIGGLALGAFTQEALAGVLAHELAHFSAGDTRLSRRAVRRHLLMAVLEEEFRADPRTRLNPLVGLVRGYHLLYRWVWAAHSRQQELAADRHEVELVGEDAAAAVLIHVTVTERLPWVRLSGIAEAAVQTNDPLDQIFKEQKRRAQLIGPQEWQEACRKELKRPTSAFDSHPALRDRLAAMGVSPKKALRLALDQKGPAAHDLLPNWPAIEKRLTEKLIDVFRENYRVKREIAQIMLGRPI